MRPGQDPRSERRLKRRWANWPCTAELVLIPGNHDRSFHTDYPGAAIRLGSEWREKRTARVCMGIFCPRQQTISSSAISIQPWASWTTQGATQKLPVFVASERLTVLPAFSPLSAGGDIRTHMPAALGEMLDDEYPRDRRFR